MGLILRRTEKMLPAVPATFQWLLPDLVYAYADLTENHTIDLSRQCKCVRPLP